MKKITRLFSLIAILLITITFTGCKVEKSYKEVGLPSELTVNTVEEIRTILKAIDDYKDYDIIGFLYFDEDQVGTATLYVHGEIPKDKVDKVVAIYSEANSKDKKGTLPKLPTGLSVGANFAGWFVTNAEGEEIRVTNVADVASFATAKYISYGEGGIVVLICMVIVFLMLALLCGITAAFKFIAPKPKKEEAKVTPQEERKTFTMGDITDDDMMVAALIATIDYHNEIKEDVRVVSIKEIR